MLIGGKPRDPEIEPKAALSALSDDRDLLETVPIIMGIICGNDVKIIGDAIRVAVDVARRTACGHPTADPARAG